MRPKLGKIDIDYQKLHDAFFKWQTKPRMTMHGDLYYEGKEFEIRWGGWKNKPVPVLSVSISCLKSDCKLERTALRQRNTKHLTENVVFTSLLNFFATGNFKIRYEMFNLEE